MNITIANQKGGVGKTTTTVNIAAGLAHKGFKTLIIDTDPQCNSTSVFFEPHETEKSLFLAFSEREFNVRETVKETHVKGLYAVPASIHLAKVERMLAGEIDAPIKLKKALQTVTNDFDFIMIDSPPSLGLLTVNGLVASDHVIIPIAPSPWALEGVEDFLDTFKGVKETFNEELKILGVLITLYDSRTTLARDAAIRIKEMFGDLAFDEIIHRSIRLEESPAFKEDIFSFAPDSKGAVSYEKVVEEVIRRVRK